MESTLKASDSYQKCDIKSSNKKSALDDVDKLLLRPMEYFVSASGKHFGQNIIETLNYWMDVPKEKLEIITEIIYNFRNFSLLIDDIQDNSALRRGIPTAHTVFGVVNTVMAANAAAVINLEKASELDHPEVTTSGWTTHYKLSCQPVDYSNDKMAVRMASYVWWHLMLKIVDLIETTFFVLRKKFNQVSILHVYHHISVVITAWVVCKYIPGGMATFTIPLNSSVHVLMYIYYILASLGPEMQKKLKVIKSKLTAIQIIQLTLIVIHSLQVFLPSCHVNVQMKWICAFYITNVIMMIFLFLRFYFKSFPKKKKNV